MIVICKFESIRNNSKETSNNEHDWALVKDLNVLHHDRNKKQLRH